MNKFAVYLNPALNYDDSITSTMPSILKGVEIMQGNTAGAGNAKKGFFGSTVSFSSTDYRAMCRMDPTSDTNRLCSTWSNYLRYSWAMNSSLPDEMYRFNQWHEEQLYYELHLTCNHDVGLGTTGVCGGF